MAIRWPVADVDCTVSDGWVNCIVIGDKTMKLSNLTSRLTEARHASSAGSAIVRACGCALAVLCLLIGLPTVTLALPSDVSGYHLVFDEPFNGTSLSDTKLGYQWTGYEGANGKTDAVSVSGGYLTLTSYSTNDGGTLKHWGGCVATEAYGGINRQWTYGYFEARIQFSNAPGNNMAFWMVSDVMFDSISHPASDGNEVDIIEHRQTDGDNNSIPTTQHMALHWGGYGSDHDSVSANVVTSGLNSGFHTLGLLWTPSEYKFYVDDVLKKTWTASFWDWSDFETKYVMSNGPEWIILDTSPSGGWCGTIPAEGYGSLATSTTKMVVDYLRVYHPNPAPSLTISAPSTTVTSAGPVTYTVTYTGATAVTLTASNVTLNKTGSANGSVSVSGTGTSTRTVTISSVAGAGTLGISIADNTASGGSGQAAPCGPSATFTVDNTKPVTTISPAGGIYNASLDVSLTANEPATIYYTTDGTVPTTASTRYTTPVHVTQSTTLRFFAVDTAGCAEAARIERYTILTSDGSIAAVRQMADGAAVSLGGKDLYLVYGGSGTFGYIEEPNRSSGIRVEGSISLVRGNRICLIGTARKPSGGEPYIQVSRMTPAGDATVTPLGATNRAVAAGRLDGMQVTIWGRVKPGFVTSNSYVLTDGSDSAGVKVVTRTIPSVIAGVFVVVTGAVGYNGERVLYE